MNDVNAQSSAALITVLQVLVDNMEFDKAKFKADLREKLNTCAPDDRIAKGIIGAFCCDEG